MAKLTDVPKNEQPLAERYRLAARTWREADGVARYYKENKEAVLSQMVMAAMDNDPGIAINKAERLVKGSKHWEEFIKKLVDAHNLAADLKIEMKAIEIEAEDIKQRNIRAAQERRYG